MDFTLFKTSVQQLGGELKKISASVEAKKQRREDLEILPLPRSDVIADMQTWVKEYGRHHYLNGLGNVLKIYTNQPLKRRNTTVGLPPVVCLKGGTVTNETGPAAIMYLLGDPICAGFERASNELDGPEDAGPPRAERLREIEKIDAEIGKLEAREAELIGEADKAGVSLKVL